MKIKSELLYTVKETAVFLDVSERYLQQKAKKEGLKKIDNRYLFKGDSILEILAKRSEQKQRSEANKTPNKRIRLVGSFLTEIQELKDKLQQKEEEVKRLKSENENLKQAIKKHPDLSHSEQLEKAIELITFEAVKKGLNHRVFSDDEYTEMIGTLAQVDSQEEQIVYLRKRVEKQDEVLTKLANTVGEQLSEKRERNFIEAKEKGFDS